MAKGQSISLQLPRALSSSEFREENGRETTQCACLTLLSWGTTCNPQASSAAPLTAHNSPTLELHIMKTLPCDLQTTSHARAVAIPPPTTLSQKHHLWLMSVVGTEFTCPAAYPLRWLLTYSELCNHHHYLIPKYFLCP